MLRICSLVLVALAARGQNIYTVAGIPENHRSHVDGQTAASAPLGSVYGLLIDKLTGRLIFHDESLVLRLETDGSLLTLVGLGPYVPSGDPPVLASFLRVGTFEGWRKTLRERFMWRMHLEDMCTAWGWMGW